MSPIKTSTEALDELINRRQTNRRGLFLITFQLNELFIPGVNRCFTRGDFRMGKEI